VSAEVALDILIGGAITGGLYALIALGLNLQYGLMRILNVAHGEFLMVGAYLTYALHVSLGINPLLTVLVTGPAALGVGLLLHRTLYAVLGERTHRRPSSPARSCSPSAPSWPRTRPTPLGADLRGYSYLSTPLRLLGAPFAANRVVAAAVALAVGAGFYVFLRRSLVGKAVRALMQDPDGARLVGVNVRRVHAFCFGLGVAMSAVAGSLISMAFELTPFIGLGYTVTALVVIILGGLGNVLGSLVGGLVLGVVETAAVSDLTVRHPGPSSPMASASRDLS
jgi:branched-chain amino acid transport system permease protein